MISCIKRFQNPSRRCTVPSLLCYLLFWSPRHVGWILHPSLTIWPLTIISGQPEIFLLQVIVLLGLIAFPRQPRLIAFTEIDLRWFRAGPAWSNHALDHPSGKKVREKITDRIKSHFGVFFRKEMNKWWFTENGVNCFFFRAQWRDRKHKLACHLLSELSLGFRGFWNVSCQVEIF